jgi:hypothetical protein
MRSLLALVVLVFATNAFAMKYSDLTADQRETVEARLRGYIPTYQVALDIAMYNLKVNIPKDTKSSDVLEKVKIEKFGTVENLFNEIVKLYSAPGTDVMVESRGQQRLLDLQREDQQLTSLTWALYWRPVADAKKRDAYLDSVLDIVSLQPYEVRVTFLQRQGCAVTVTETGSACN